MRRVAAVGMIGAAVGLLASSCAAILGIEEPSPVGGETTTEEAGPAADVLDAAAGVDADASATEGPDGPRCPPGPPDAAPMVLVGREGGRMWCVDPYEVTQLEYGAFLAAKAGGTGGQPENCSWNTTYVPLYGFPASPSRIPITYVNWCDALAYCSWADKRLCGAVDGGVLPLDRQATADDEWFMACSHNDDGLHELPYGNQYDPKGCNDFDSEAGRAVAVGSIAKCQGGFDGLFDMSGNVREWIASCNLGVDGGRLCANRGGAYYDDPYSSDYCATTGSSQRSPAGTQNVGIGIRCCADSR